MTLVNLKKNVNRKGVLRQEGILSWNQKKKTLKGLVPRRSRIANGIE